MSLHQLVISMLLLKLVPAETVHESKSFLHLLGQQEPPILRLACIRHPELDLDDILSIFGLYLLPGLFHASSVILLNRGLLLSFIGRELSLLVVVLLQHGVHIILFLLLVRKGPVLLLFPNPLLGQFCLLLFLDHLLLVFVLQLLLSLHVLSLLLVLLEGNPHIAGQPLQEGLLLRQVLYYTLDTYDAMNSSDFLVLLSLNNPKAGKFFRGMYFCRI